MKCFLVEDEKNLNMLLTFSLSQEGYEVTSFHTYHEAIGNISEEGIWIVDINLPDGSGLDIVKALKNESMERPVLIISARDSEIDRLLGLEIGSDDYVTKPFLPRELVLRLKKYQKHVKDSNVLKIGTFAININQRQLFIDGIRVELTSKEFDLIHFFMKHPNQAFSRDNILNQVWGDDYFGSDRVVDDLIRRVRKKIVTLPIETVYGFGYRWCDGEE